jgi:hypothetical protein
VEGHALLVAGTKVLGYGTSGQFVDKIPYVRLDPAVRVGKEGVVVHEEGGDWCSKDGVYGALRVRCIMVSLGIDTGGEGGLVCMAPRVYDFQRVS